MRRDKEQNKDGEDIDAGEGLTGFEADLASLRPHVEGMDRRRLLLALPKGTVPFSSDENRDSPPRIDEMDRRRRLLREEAIMLKHNLRESGMGQRRRGCTHAGGHRFLCVYCGCEAPITRGVGRWAWAASLAAMTTAAAVLLAMLVVRPGAENITTVQATLPSPASEEGPGVRAGDRETPAIFTDSGFSNQQVARGGDKMSYIALRDQILAHGIESWKMPALASVGTARTEEAADAPLNYREALERLLEEQNCRGS